jgi:tetratricopeptide (TPR) repeat protein
MVDMAEENRVYDEHPSPRIYPIQFVQVGTLPDVPAPLARISTCGGMTIEVLHEVLETDPPQGRYVVVTPQQRRLGSTTGLNLLSALVSLPGHYAAKSWLMERLSRSKSDVADDDESWAGMVRVDNIVTLLRGLLCPPGIAGEKELRKVLVSYAPNHFESGPGYQLAGEPLIWLDVDVIEASVKEACLLEQKGHDALPVWERASTLVARGGYLLDERYSDWAESKRREVEGYQRQAVHALHRLYLARDDGTAGEQVLLLLRSYWQTHPTDEDVLRPLLELLGKRGCVQEAEEYYVHLCQELEVEGFTPHPRTQQIIQNVRDGQSTSPYTLETKPARNTTTTQISSLQDGMYAPFSHITKQDIIEIHQNLSQNFALLSKQDVESGEGVDRGQVAKYLGIAGVVLLQPPENLFHFEPYERLRRALRKSATVDSATIKHLESITNDCWRMIPVVAGVVSHYSRGYALEQLGVVTRLLEGSQPLVIHQQLCSIAGELSLIVANISSNMRDYRSAKRYYELSIEAAQEAKNGSLQAVGLARLSFNSTRNDQPDVALPLVLEALHLMMKDDKYAKGTMRAWVAVVLAEVYANLKNAKACFEALEQAELQMDSAIREDDPYHTTFSSSLLAGYKGMCYTLLHLPEDAEKVLHNALAQMPASSDYQKGYILSDLANACIQQGRVDEMYAHASEALALAAQTKAREVFQRIRKLRTGLDSWSSTLYVKNLDKQICDTECVFY